jgi:hypothetical protein
MHRLPFGKHPSAAENIHPLLLAQIK